MAENCRESEDFEFDNRVNNLMWTICGNYGVEMPRNEKINSSKFNTLYFGIIAGARHKYVDWHLINQYIEWRSCSGFSREKLQAILLPAIDAMAINLLTVERPGIPDIQKKACLEIIDKLKSPVSDCLSDEIEFSMSSVLAGISVSVRPIMRELALELISIAKTNELQNLIKAIDEVYIRFFRINDYVQFDMQSILENHPRPLVKTKNLSESVLNSELLNKKSSKVAELEKTMSGERQTEYRSEDNEFVEALNRQAELNCGESYLKGVVVRRIESRLCKGVHRDCQLHFTEGVIRSKNNNQMQLKRAQKRLEQNRSAYEKKQQIYEATINRLKKSLIQTLRAEQSTYAASSDSGTINAQKLWRLGRVPATRLFKKMESNDNGKYVVDLMIDSSHSQFFKQATVAIQAYIIVRAIVGAGIPCRVNGFYSFFDYTILKRYRDYDDDLKQTENIFEYTCEGCNRDGLALKSVCDTLYTRAEENKILIVLSDGKPNDIHLPTRNSGKEFRGAVSYSGGIGIDDTAKEVRIARQRGIMVLGIFTGDEKDLKAEKLIFGKDFIYTREMNHFGDIIAAYLKRIIAS